ncbi:hypothetical protein Ahia01_001071800 [Argonauta hians]
MDGIHRMKMNWRKLLGKSQQSEDLYQDMSYPPEYSSDDGWSDDHFSDVESSGEEQQYTAPNDTALNDTALNDTDHVQLTSLKQLSDEKSSTAPSLPPRHPKKPVAANTPAVSTHPVHPTIPPLPPSYIAPPLPPSYTAPPVPPSYTAPPVPPTCSAPPLPTKTSPVPPPRSTHAPPRSTHAPPPQLPLTPIAPTRRKNKRNSKEIGKKSPGNLKECTTTTNSPKNLQEEKPCDNYLEELSWFHGKSGREEIQKVLQIHEKSGMYAVRRSNRISSEHLYSLTLYHKGTIYNFPIRTRKLDKKFALGYEKPGEPAFSSLEELVTYFNSHDIILANQDLARLQQPLPKSY